MNRTISTIGAQRPLNTGLVIAVSIVIACLLTLQPRVLRGEVNNTASRLPWSNSPKQLSNNDRHHYTLPDVKLIGMNGKEISLASVLNQDYPIMLDFIFTSCPSFCPIISANFAHLDRKLLTKEDPLQIVSISIDPDQDTPTRLKEYAKRYHASSRWQFYTGDYQDIIRIQRAFDAYRGDKMNHEQLVFMRGSNQDSWIRLRNIITPKELIEQYQKIASEPRRDE